MFWLLVEDTLAVRSCAVAKRAQVGTTGIDEPDSDLRTEEKWRGEGG
jgi:hypothetical protein